MLRRRLRLRSLNGSPRSIGSVADLAAVAAELAPCLGKGDVIYLRGPIGVGKTTFAQVLGTELGVEESITSPTYVLVHRYAAPIPVIHLDLYRLEGVADRDLADVIAEIEPEAITLIEWPEIAGAGLPAATWIVNLAFATAGSRTIRVSSAP